MDTVVPAVSVVVTSYNQKSDLERLLPMLMAQDLAVEHFEIIVVDDGSNDGSIELLRSFAERIVLIENRVNQGRSRARNAGILASTGELVVLLDGDHTVRRDFLREHIDSHQHQYCVVVGRSTYSEQRDYTALHHYLDGCGAAKFPAGVELPGRYFLTRNCSIPRRVFSEIGFFDENFVGWGGEDLDFGMRIEAASIPIMGASTCAAVHYHLRSLDHLLEQLFEYGKSGVPLLLQKHPVLFRELSLNRVVSLSGGSARDAAIRFVYRAIQSAPIYFAVRSCANLFRGLQLPRILFDYLFWRQYTRGYEASRRELSNS